MAHAITSPLTANQISTDVELSALNEQLHSALESSRQVAFDWHIPTDRVRLSGALRFGLCSKFSDADLGWESHEMSELLHHEDEERIRECVHEPLDGTIDAGNRFRAEFRVKNNSGAWRWIEANGKVVARDSKGRAIRLAGTFSDIHECKRAEHKAACLCNLGLAASHVSRAIVRVENRDTLLQEICRIAVEYAGFNAAWVALLEQDKKQVAPAAAYGNGTDRSPLLQTVREELKRIDLAIARTESKPRICNDFPNSSGPQNAQTDARHPRCGVFGSFPLQLNGRPVGALILHASDSEIFGPAAIGLIEEMTRDISLALEKHERESRREAMEAQRANSEMLKSAILTAAPDCIFSVGRTGKIIGFNQTAERTFGISRSDVLGKAFIETIIAPEWREKICKHLDLICADGKSRMLNQRIELEAMRADGSVFPAELATVPLSVHNEFFITAFIRDITDKKRSEALERGQSRILNLIATGNPLRETLAELAQFAEHHAQRSLYAIFRLNNEGATLPDRIAPSLPTPYVSQIGEAMPAPCNDDGGTLHIDAETAGVTHIAKAHLRFAWRDLTLKNSHPLCAPWPIVGKNRKVLGTFALYSRDATPPTADEEHLAGICTRLAAIAIERLGSDEKIRYLAHYDGLTSLPNRFLFKEYLDLALRNARRSGKKFAVLFVDLDKFKEINDTFGHDAGDQVLREIATRMRDCLRHTDKIARMGGDEFYVLVEDLNDAIHAADVAQKLLHAAARPVHAGGEKRYLSASIGIGVFPDDGNNSQTLLHNADCAMYRAKELGKNRYEFFSAYERSGGVVLSLLKRTARPDRHNGKGMEMT